MKASKNIKLFGIFNVVDSLDFFIPIKLVYFYYVTGSYSSAAGLISAVWMFSALFEIPTGIFSDYIGRKKTMVLGALCVTLAYILFAIGTDYWLLLLGALLDGLSRAFYSGNNDAYLNDSLRQDGQEDHYDHFYGRINSFLMITSFIASLSSGFIASYSFRLLMWLSLIPQVIALGLTLVLKDTQFKTTQSTNIYAHIKGSFKEIKQNVNLRYLSLAKIFGGAGEAAYEFHVAVVSAVWPTWAIGVFRAIQDIGATPGYYFASRIIKKFGKTNVILLQSFESLIANFIAVLFQNIFSPLLIASNLIFYGASSTAQESMLQKEFSDKQRATIASLNSLGSSIYFALVIYIAGLIANTYGPFIGFFSTQVFFLPVLYFQWKLFSRIKSEESPP